MKGLKIIPLTFLIILLTYLGMWFVEINRDEIVVHLGNENQTHPTAIGFVVVTSTLIGMCLAGAFCGIEIIALSIQNRRLKRRIAQLAQSQKPKNPAGTEIDQTADIVAPKISGRFS